MRAVAEYVMRGRRQALWVSVLGASTWMFAWLSAAVLALVTLRRGPAEGGFILAWAILPAGFLLATLGDAGPLGTLVGTMALALVLRSTVSWPLALCAGSMVGAVTGLLLLWLGDNTLQQLAEFFAKLFASFEAQLEQQGGEKITLTPPGIVTISGPE